jgi:dynein heavy chain
MRSKASDPSALHVVLFQEAERYNDLLARARRGLADLRAGLCGAALMSAELDAVASALHAGRVPSGWLRAYPSLKPLGAWARDLLARVEQLARWAEGGYPRVYWLGGFTYPSGFLTAVLQTAARRGGVPIDGLAFEHGVVAGGEREVAAPPKEGVYVRGLYLEGELAALAAGGWPGGVGVWGPPRLPRAPRC